MPTQPDLRALFESLALPTEGVVLVNKPTGVTSHDVVAVFRRLTGVKRIGHAGTLDPLASGLLIILIGREFTKKQADFMHLPKVYQVTAVLGSTTDTYDAEGTITTRQPWAKYAQLTQAAIQVAAQKFTGKIVQTVPGYSAVKVQGQKLYDLARRGQLADTELPSRQVEVTTFIIDDVKTNAIEQTMSFSATIGCGSGTYVRSLIHDLGQELGCGAYVTQLHRVSIGPYQVPLSTPALPLEIP